MTYVPGDPQPEHDGDVFNAIKRESGDEGQDIVKQSFTVSLGGVTALWQKLSGLWR
jgi:hypothetical protein